MELCISRAEVEESADFLRIRHTLELSGAERLRVECVLPPGPPPTSEDAALALGILPAQGAGLPLRLEAPVTPVLSSSLPVLQERLRLLLDDSPAPVAVRAATQCPPPSTKVVGEAAFCSGGLDSLHTAVELSDRLSALVYIRSWHGIEDESQDQVAAENVRRIATALGLEYVEVRSDLRNVLRRVASDWATVGAMFAYYAHLLSGRFSRLYVSSGYTPRLNERSFGSQPDVDPLWSGNFMELVHYGFGVDRVGKARRSALRPELLAHLRVCFLPPTDGRLNCGSCEKCIRTMVNLELAGAREHCSSLPAQIPLRRIARFPFKGGSSLRWAIHNLESARRHEAAPDLLEALSQGTRRARRRMTSSRRGSRLLRLLSGAVMGRRGGATSIETSDARVRRIRSALSRREG